MRQKKKSCIKAQNYPYSETCKTAVNKNNSSKNKNKNKNRYSSKSKKKINIIC